MENVLIIEEVLRILNEERIKVKEKFYSLEEEYFNVNKGNRKRKLYLAKCQDNTNIELQTIKRLIKIIEKIK